MSLRINFAADVSFDTIKATSSPSELFTAKEIKLAFNDITR